jgi:hypothetical protein
MSYGQPGMPGFAPVAPPPRQQGTAAALPGLAVVMIVNVVLELALLGFDLSRKGVGYLETAIWDDSNHLVSAPWGFFPNDTALVVGLVVLIIGAFNGKGWVRPAGTAMLLLNGYSTTVFLIEELSTSAGRHAFGSPAVPNLWLNLDVIAQILLALAFVLMVAVTVNSGPRPAFGAGYAPLPPQPQPGGAPGFPPPVPNQPPQPPNQPPYGYR